MAEYVVSVDQSPEYDVGVNYEIPSKSIQNTNLILDHLNSQFNGSKTLFALTHNNNVYTPINDQQILVVKNNLVLEPIEDYNILVAIYNLLLHQLQLMMYSLLLCNILQI